MPKQVKAFELTPPSKWRAGWIGVKEFYFDCAECNKSEPEIKGVLGTGPTYERVAIYKRNPAMFCADCWNRVVRAQ